MAYKVTQEEFLSRLKDIHGDKYGCEKAIYKDVKTPVILTCPVHGDFIIAPDKIFNRHQGCAKCSGKSKTTEDFKKEARKVHGDRYDYSKSIYVKAHEPLTITCKIHGDFKMSPYNHITLGCNCQKCSGVSFVTAETFFERANNKFGDRFEYDLKSYKNQDTKIDIKCKKCGTVFRQTPSNHISSLQGGCPTCRYGYIADVEVTSFEEFEQRAKAVHGEKYTYHKDKYKRIGVETTITCPIHGDFEQIAISHVKGCGCKKCAFDSIGELHKKDTENFIFRAVKKYGDRFDFTDSVYSGWNKKILIKCNTCGEKFEQRANNFFRGLGCPNCNLPSGEAFVKQYLDENSVEYKQQYFFYNDYLFCANKKLFVDFYLPSLNTVIEFNGAQHYRPIDYFGGESAFQRQQERDAALRKYCKDKCIKLIEISYKDKSNIEEILKKELKDSKNKKKSLNIPNNNLYLQKK